MLWMGSCKSAAAFWCRVEPSESSDKLGGRSGFFELEYEIICGRALEKCPLPW